MEHSGTISSRAEILPGHILRLKQELIILKQGNTVPWDVFGPYPAMNAEAAGLWSDWTSAKQREN